MKVLKKYKRQGEIQLTNEFGGIPHSVAVDFFNGLKKSHPLYDQTRSNVVIFPSFYIYCHQIHSLLIHNYFWKFAIFIWYYYFPIILTFALYSY
jgi:hypothetical protein